MVRILHTLATSIQSNVLESKNTFMSLNQAFHIRVLMGREIMCNHRVLELATDVSCTVHPWSSCKNLWDFWDFQQLLLMGVGYCRPCGLQQEQTIQRPGYALFFRLFRLIRFIPFPSFIIIPTETNPTPVSCDIARLCLRSWSWWSSKMSRGKRLTRDWPPNEWATIRLPSCSTQDRCEQTKKARGWNWKSSDTVLSNMKSKAPKTD